MKKKDHVVKLVEEMLFHKAEAEKRDAELDRILAESGRKKRAPKPEPEAPAEDGADSTKEKILSFMRKDRARTMTAKDAEAALGISPTMFGYHMKGLMEAKKVKRVKRGHYQIRGRS